MRLKTFNSVGFNRWHVECMLESLSPELDVKYRLGSIYLELSGKCSASTKKKTQ
jgi:hypothetical protein